MSDAILKAEGVCFGYKRDNAVLSGVSLSFKRGELTGIIGPNGSGKTTLIKLLSGALRPSGGCVTLDGRVARNAYVLIALALKPAQIRLPAHQRHVQRRHIKVHVRGLRHDRYAFC